MKPNKAPKKDWVDDCKPADLDKLYAASVSGKLAAVTGATVHAHTDVSFLNGEVKWGIDQPDIVGVHDLAERIDKSYPGMTEKARLVTACAFFAYQHKQLSAGKTAKMLGLGRQQFEDIRASLDIFRPFTESELERDCDWAAAN